VNTYDSTPDDDNDATAADPDDFAVDVDDAVRPSVVTVRGDLDAGTAPVLDRALAQIIDARRADCGDRDDLVVIDVSGLSFVDSAGLRSLLQARAGLVAVDSDLRLRGVTDRFRRLLEITALVDELPAG
jgi:anti-sigma B factor antagonist